MSSADPVQETPADPAPGVPTDPVLGAQAPMDPVLEAFGEAQRAFRKKLKDPQIYDEILTTRNATEIYIATAKLQETTLGKGHLRNLAKISRFLEKLSSYAAVIEVFIQVKPDLLALIWGPIKLILQWSSQLKNALDQVTDVMERIGQALPQFTRLVQTFEMSDAIRDALALFYEDILDFYRLNLDFFRKARWKQMFDVIWPKFRPEIDVVVNNLEKHGGLLRNEATVLDIQEAREARVQSIAHFKNTNAFQERQKFLGLKARVSPELYDEKLDWFRNRCVADCAKWLFRDQAFSEWLDPSTKMVAWFWLQGIPGAGKTYLSATAIDHTKKHHRTLFAFVSHLTKASLTAVSVIQSLVFQAADDDEDFQSALVESKERELEGNLGHAAGLLGTFLKTAAGPTYIIIDGLDEMDECERQILLKRLDELSKESENLRLLISSRAEADISRALDQKSKGARVHGRNYGSIQNYVDRRSQDWMDRREFDSSTKIEMRSLLSPLSMSAKGMFLYARIILDNLEQMTSMDEIRHELKALPEDLNDAYGRIFRRINESKPHLRDKCRRILGWIECAPIPLTIPEMEQAVSVDLNPDGKSDRVPQVLAKLDFVQMCGPIIEVVGEKLQFVHFTVPEYIFSTEISDCIDKDKAAEDLVISFLAYLSSGVLDPELDDDEISERILTGHYRLFQYASFYWLVLLPPIESPGNSRLENLLHRVVAKGKNYDFEDDTDSSEHIKGMEYLRRKSPEVYDTLCAMMRFRSDNGRWEWNWTNSENWSNLDPLTTSQMLVRIQERYDGLVSDPDIIESIRPHYGSRIFKCTYPFCTHSRRGFADKRDLDAHFKDHGRPWKCTLPSCEFCSIGFASRKSRDDHLVKYHLPAVSQLQESNDDFEKLDPEEVQPMLFALLVEEDAERVKRLLASSGGKKLKGEVIDAARRWAASELKSLAMTDLLTPPYEKYLPHEIVISAVDSEDVEFVEWALAKAKPSDCAKFMKVMLSAESEKIYTLWEDYLLKNLAGASEGESNQESRIKLEDLFKQPLWNGAKNNTLKEARSKLLLRKLQAHLTPGLLGFILGQIARSSCSVPLAEEVLKLGAPIDYPWRYGRTGMTAVQAAARQTTEEAAHLMQFLVFQGATTEDPRYRKEITKEKGAAQIVRWLGVTWDELQDEYRRSLKVSSD